MTTDYEEIEGLLRPNIASLVPYSCARNDFTGVAEVYLDANENWRDFVGGQGRNRYPDPLSTKVREGVEQALGLPASNLVVGNGSDEIIDLLMRIFCVPGKDSVMLLPPTYGAYRVLGGQGSRRRTLQAAVHLLAKQSYRQCVSAGTD
jgi:histidinol-phosphate aminotransferase